MHEGDMVYMYDPLASENKASKFSNRYTGPYRVVETKGDHLVKLVSLKTGKEISHLVNICKLKWAHGPWSPALPNTIPELVRDATGSKSTGQPLTKYLSRTTPRRASSLKGKVN